MKFLFQNPLRVYLILFILFCVGLYSGSQLPISLFPNSSKVTVRVTIPLYSMSPRDFYQDYGYRLESQLRALELKINTLSAEYSYGDVSYKIDFDWSVGGEQALSKVREVMAGTSAGFPQTMRENYYVDKWSENNTFVALAFYSDKKSPDEIYNLIQPTLEPEILSVKEVQSAELYNPQKKEIVLEFLPEKLSSFGLHPSDLEGVLKNAMREFNGGRIEYQNRRTQIYFDPWIKTKTDLENFSFYIDQKRIVYLKDIADIRMGSNETSRNIFRTSGSSALILWADPKPGANVKEMSEQIITIVNRNQKLWPEDIQFKFLVNPAEFINSSVNHVAFEVILAAFLAVVILFLFIGSLKNVITAAVEIPLSIILALILMKIFDMNLNLISLGGLALSAGMNVDASVVVIENIFRHLKLYPNRSKLDVIVGAVSEVYQPILVATLASLIVFFPIIFTTGLTNSLLGDLAKTVIFSHGLSAIVALVLVPTVRLHFSAWFDSEGHSPIEPALIKLENFYERTLSILIRNKKLVISISVAVSVVFVFFLTVLLPRLPKELIGKPETDWLIVITNSKNWKTLEDFDEGTSAIDTHLREKYADKIDYTFSQMGAGWGNVMVRLKNKSDLEFLKKEVEKEYPDTPNLKIMMEPWNPSELVVPNPAPFVVHITGSDTRKRAEVAELFLQELEDQDIFPRTRIFPDITKNYALNIRTYRPQYEPSAISSFTFLSGQPRYLMYVKDPVTDKSVNISIQFPKKYTQSLESLKSMPYYQNQHVVPLSAVGNFEFVDEPKGFYRLDGKDIVSISGRTEDTKEKEKAKEKAKAFVKNFIDRHNKDLVNTKIEIQDSEKEITDSIDQLLTAVLISIVMIFILMVLLFGSWIDAFLILLAIPFGIMGTILALTVFGSVLSLNSALGVILLNGISVANSIILVDFIKQLKNEGISAKESAIKAARIRLRPILMTSLTTVIGMMPIAFGFGSGGKILQPLGISVSGGLWVSMLFTLYFVPTLQCFYYEWKEKKI
ncbi:MAG: efflux RND transporter permease subunit [Bdellovibrionaceae bacterium]|nr:efflux RND transporter permease subunit [Pseudobdellovibrionaceae bacterium]